MNKLLPVALLLLSCGSTLAQYKVVRPDGSITYTDRHGLKRFARALRGLLLTRSA